MSWKLAKSLEKLRDQVNQLFPDRDKTSDGSIGDQSHAARKSDHNPNQFGVVTAIDFDADLSETENVSVLVSALQASQDRRIKYLIWNRQITVKGDVTHWKPYHGTNAHQHHAHISVSTDPALYDDDRPWNLNLLAPETTPKLPMDRVLLIGMTGEDVRRLQIKLVSEKLMSTSGIDGIFGPMTGKAVRAFQAAHNLREDGRVGPNTRKALGL